MSQTGVLDRAAIVHRGRRQKQQEKKKEGKKKDMAPGQQPPSSIGGRLSSRKASGQMSLSEWNTDVIHLSSQGVVSIGAMQR